MLLFYVLISKQPEFDRIFQITEIMETEISLKVYRNKKGASQCYNCQGFFHSPLTCNLLTRCIKCAGTHKPRDCKKNFNTLSMSAVRRWPPGKLSELSEFPQKYKGKNLNVQLVNSKSILNSNWTFSPRKVDSFQSYLGATSRKSHAIKISIDQSQPRMLLKLQTSKICLNFKNNI